jgi:hypothetical protein
MTLPYPHPAIKTVLALLFYTHFGVLHFSLILFEKETVSEQVPIVDVDAQTTTIYTTTGYDQH